MQDEHKIAASKHANMRNALFLCIIIKDRGIYTFAFFLKYSLNSSSSQYTKQPF